MDAESGSSFPSNSEASDYLFIIILLYKTRIVWAWHFIRSALLYLYIFAAQHAGYKSRNNNCKGIERKMLLAFCQLESQEHNEHIAGAMQSCK